MPKVKIKNITKVEFHGLKPGETKTVETGFRGALKDVIWRRRLRDKDIEIIKITKTQTKTETKEDPKKGDK